MENTYKVPQENLNTLQVRVDKLARRCKRNGIAAPVMTIGEATEVQYKDEDGFDRIRRVYAVILSSIETPKIEGSEFIAVLSPVTNDEGTMLGNILRAVPGASVTPEARFRSANNYCDHCKTERFRLETFVIADGTTQRQIGRNCLALYLGLTNPHQLAAIAEILIDLSDLGEMSERNGFGGCGIETRVPLDEVLQTAASAIRQHGWLSGKSAREFDKTSTAARVSQWVFGHAKDREKIDPQLTIDESDKKLAAETEKWLGTLGEQTDDYMYNLSLLSQSASITGKNFGLTVSAINAYSRAKKREIRRNKQIESDKNSVFVGAPGERRLFENLIVVYTTSWENDFGVTHLYKMKREEDVIVYFSSKDLGFEIGTVIPRFKATVKKHEIREGIYQTIITRGNVPPRDLSKEEKRAVNKLKKINKTLEYSSETYLAIKCLDDLISEIQQNGFSNLAVQENK